MPDGVAVAGVVLVLLAGAAAWDLQRAETRTLVVYTTPALKDVFERVVIPGFVEEGGTRVEPVYVAAGEQFNRLRLGGRTPEADVFVHASPLFIEKGFAEGRFQPFRVEAAEGADATFLGREVDGGRVWYAFAWTPLVEVYAPRFDAPPDLATADVTFGLAHPLLSNNGVYNVLFYESLDPAAGRHALARTTVQPTNARSSMNGVADGSFDVTLGYEAVTLLYQGKGARVGSALPRLGGEDVFVPVVASVGLVQGRDHPQARALVHFLFEPQTQAALAAEHWRPVLGGPAPAGGIDVSGLEAVTWDWTRWEDLEAKLKDYEVRT